eukprot:2365544-Amphidinium_carterae.1
MGWHPAGSSGAIVEAETCWHQRKELGDSRNPWTNEATQGKFVPASGRMYKRLRDYLTRLHTDIEVKQLLTNGHMVLHVCFTPDPGLGEHEHINDAQHTFWHISLYYLRPWRPTFAELQTEVEVAVPGEAAGAEQDARIPFWLPLQDDVFRMHNVWELLATMRPESRIRVRLLKLCSEQTPILSRRHIYATPYQAVPMSELFGGQLSEKKSRRCRTSVVDIFEATTK